MSYITSPSIINANSGLNVYKELDVTLSSPPNTKKSTGKTPYIILDKPLPSNSKSGKTHYEVLDGLRGIAAIAVVVYHLLQGPYLNHDENIPIGHAFLAVDFFFCLSGFVIGYAYDNRINSMGTPTFFKNRLIRLHPLVVLGSVLGLLQFLFFSATYSGAASIVITFFCSLLLIPFPWLTERKSEIFPFNGPSWSLFMEYIANIFYALILCKIKRSLLAAFTFFAALLLIYVSWHRGSLNLGWATYNILGGWVRIAYSLSAGLLIYRYNFILRSKWLGFASLSTLLLLAFLTPHLTNYNWLTEAVIVIFIFPLIVSFGISASAKGVIKKCCKFLGDLSYPLYMTHYWITLSFGIYFLHLKEKPEGWTFALIIGGLTFLSIILAYLVFRFYDQPVRAWLNKYAKRSKL
jgi:peptidoglycan/LPS O-acetylase OafA/YrhL